MKHLLSLLSLFTLTAVQAQLPATYDAEVDARERVRIEAARSQAQQFFADEEAACYQRFAVNDCLREVRRKRRVALEALRREEIVLNDARRAAVTAEQARRVEERSTVRQDPAEEARRAEEQKAREIREQEARQRQAERARAPRAAASAPSTEGKSPPVDDAARRAEQQRAYEMRQQRAEERRREREQQLREQGPGNGRPLPVPP